MLAPPAGAPRPFRRPHVIVLGNEKGGSGKSTTAMHLIVALLRDGHSVGSLDLDARQGTLSRYIENRQRFVRETGIALPVPEHRRIHPSQLDSAAAGRAEEAARLEVALAELLGMDFVVMDTPGSDTGLSRLGHARADTLITPLNDSFLDLDLLARLDGAGKRILGPSLYSEAAWEQKKQRALRDGGSIDWIVMRNRLSSLDARNKRDIGRLLEELSRRIGFRLAPGFSERVIFRELFPRGLTLLDLRHVDSGIPLNMSQVAARQEVRALLEAIGLPQPLPEDRAETPCSGTRTPPDPSQGGHGARAMAGDRDKLPSTPSSAEVDAFLRKVAAIPGRGTGGPRGRLIFAMDATASREPSWDRACHIQAEMFKETAALGGLDVQLVWYRGFREFEASPWIGNAKALLERMTGVTCRGGQTQIAAVLRHAIAETRRQKVNALVFVGDCMEEDVDLLCHLAGQLGLLGVPAFMFHEGGEPVAAKTFREIARLTNGAYCRFDSASPRQLRELLGAVAVYAAGGRAALEDYGRRTGGEVLRLTQQMGKR